MEVVPHKYFAEKYEFQNKNKACFFLFEKSIKMFQQL